MVKLCFKPAKSQPTSESISKRTPPGGHASIFLGSWSEAQSVPQKAKHSMSDLAMQTPPLSPKKHTTILSDKVVQTDETKPISEELVQEFQITSPESSLDSFKISQVLHDEIPESSSARASPAAPLSTRPSSQRSSVMGAIIYGKGECPIEKSPTKRMFPHKHNISSIKFGDDGGDVGLLADEGIKFKAGLSRRPQPRGSQIVFEYPPEKPKSKEKSVDENIVHGLPSGMHGVR